MGDSSMNRHEQPSTLAARTKQVARTTGGKAPRRKLASKRPNEGIPDAGLSRPSSPTRPSKRIRQALDALPVLLSVLLEILEAVFPFIKELGLGQDVKNVRSYGNFVHISDAVEGITVSGLVQGMSNQMALLIIAILREETGVEGDKHFGNLLTRVNFAGDITVSQLTKEQNKMSSVYNKTQKDYFDNH